MFREDAAPGRVRGTPTSIFDATGGFLARAARSLSRALATSSRRKLVNLMSAPFPEKWNVGAFLDAGVANALRKMEPGGKAAGRKGSGTPAAAKRGTVFSGAPLSVAWGWLITLVVVYFAGSCIEQTARMKQADLDKKEVARVHGGRRSNRRSFGTPSKKYRSYVD